MHIAVKERSWIMVFILWRKVLDFVEEEVVEGFWWLGRWLLLLLF